MKKATASATLGIALLLAVAVLPEAQQPSKLYRIGFLSLARRFTRTTKRSGNVCASWDMLTAGTFRLSGVLLKASRRYIPILLLSWSGSGSTVWSSRESEPLMPRSKRARRFRS